MTNSHAIGILGFGEAGRSWGGTLTGSDAVRLSAFDIQQSTDRVAEFADAARSCDAELVPDASALAQSCTTIICAVTAANSLIAAQSLAADLNPGQTFIDINSVAPGKKAETAKIVRASGAAYVDMAVMAPVHPRGHKTPVLVAGDLDDGMMAFLKTLGFDFDVIDGGPGAAAGIKMVRSLFVKGLEALTSLTLIAEQAAGCFERVHASLAASFPGLNWPDGANYLLERSATHGIRRAEEMVESAKTLADLDLPEASALARDIAQVHDRIGALGLTLGGDVLADNVAMVLDGLRRRDDTGE